MNRKKELSSIDVIAYELRSKEQIAAGLIKDYLQSFPRPVAKKLLAHIVDPRVIALPRDERGMVCHSGNPAPLQTTIDGAQLAALIDLAVGDIADMLEEEWLVDGKVSIKETVLAGISEIRGEEIVSNISCNMAQFLIDCYMAVCR